MIYQNYNINNSKVERENENISIEKLLSSFKSFLLTTKSNKNQEIDKETRVNENNIQITELRRHIIDLPEFKSTTLTTTSMNVYK